MNDEIRSFNSAIDEIRDQIIDMAILVNKGLEQSVNTLWSDKSVQVKEEVINMDLKIDTMDDTIHSSVLQLMTIQVPLPRELKALTTMLQVSRELERIGDHAVNIVESCEQIEIDFETQSQNLIDEKIVLVLSMLHSSLEMLQKKNYDHANNIEKSEVKVDQHYRKIKKLITNEMKNYPARIESLAQLFLINRFLERCADHIVNIARQIKYSIY